MSVYGTFSMGNTDFTRFFLKMICQEAIITSMNMKTICWVDKTEYSLSMTASVYDKRLWQRFAQVSQYCAMFGGS